MTRETTYKMSDDYDHLIKLIKGGNIIIGFIFEQKAFYGKRVKMEYVCTIYMEGSMYKIFTESLEQYNMLFSGLEDRDECQFIEKCKELNLKYLIP